MNRVKFPLPQPIPDTPIRGISISKVVFRSTRLQKLALDARRKVGSRWAIIKPKRASRGVVWNGFPYYWSDKGFYRRGKAGDRRPLQVHVWEMHNGTPLPHGHEIFFVNRDRHDFRKSNLVALSKAEMHRKIIEIGENKQLPREQRAQIAGKRWTKHSRLRVQALLNLFNQNKTHEHSNTLSAVQQRHTRYPTRSRGN